MNLYYPTTKYKRTDKVIEDKVKKFKEKRNEFKDKDLKFLKLYNRSNLSSVSAYSIYKNIEPFINKGMKPSDFVVGFNNEGEKKTFSKEELRNLTRLTEIFKSLGIKVGVYEYKGIYDYHQIYNSNKKLAEYANEIRKNNYSPLESLIHAYMIVSDREYKQEEEAESRSISRTVYGILNTDYIVCAGYSELLKTIVREVGDENVKVFSNLISTKREEEGKVDYGFHQNNIVYIKDKKYDIDGYYYLDPTWDSKHFYDENSDGFKTNKFMYFLVEIPNIKYISGKNVIFDYVKGANEYMNLQEKGIIKKEIETFREQRKQKNYINTGFMGPASVSSDYVDFNDEVDCKRSDNIDELLSFYLQSRQDFRDFLALKQTEKYASITKDISKALDRNLERSTNEPNKMSVGKDGKVIYEYLKQNSPHIALGKIESALSVVLKKMHSEMNKDQVSKLLHMTIEDNLKEVKGQYQKDANTPLTEVTNYELK